MSFPAAIYRAMAKMSKTYPPGAASAAKGVDLLMLWCPPAFLLQVAGRWAEGILEELDREIRLDVAAHQKQAFLIEAGIAAILGREIGD